MHEIESLEQIKEEIQFRLNKKLLTEFSAMHLIQFINELQDVHQEKLKREN